VYEVENVPNFQTTNTTSNALTDSNRRIRKNE